jgi:50S ribosomal protein L16 3-hydroxylase
MDTTQALALLGNMSAQTFMKRHWQKKPLLIRQAVPGMTALMSRSALFDLAGQEGVESRLVVQEAGALAKSKGGKKDNKTAKTGAWTLQSGPFSRRALPSLKTPGWTLLVQGVDLHVQALREVLDQFRFVPDARLDDLMISFATDGGGVGPHFDSYDVFLLQAHGTRRWHIGRQKDLSLQAGAPLKILQHFEPEQTFDLEPGDMLYLPPRYAHDGVALGECMTYSIGFRAPGTAELARDLLQRLADDAEEALGTALYRDGGQPATGAPAEIPASLIAFAQAAVQAAVHNPQTLARALGELLTEPKSNVWFEGGADHPANAIRGDLALDRRSKMMFDTRQVFINGESFLASGRDAALMRQLANQRRLGAALVNKASPGAKSLLQDWMQAGWLHEC